MQDSWERWLTNSQQWHQICLFEFATMLILAFSPARSSLLRINGKEGRHLMKSNNKST